MRPVVALVGRPNVGKSTLFNRILGRRQAIVQDLPGVTRDRHYAETEHLGRPFLLVDTGGFDPEAREGMLALMRVQVQRAIEESDALILVLDAREGLTRTDEMIWEMLRRSGRPTWVAVNKVDRPSQDPLVAEFWSLGVERLWPLTAERGSGVAELLEDLVLHLPAPEDAEAGAYSEEGVRLAILGRPNVGKSTLCNALLGEDRYLTSDVPGTTRDAIDTPFRYEDRLFVLVDTAGVRRRRAVEVGLERMSVARTMQALERCHVAVLVIDGFEGLTDQDKKLAALIVDRGKGLVLAVNKWDRVEGDAAQQARQRIEEESAFFSFAPMVFLSALTGRNVHRLLPVVERVRSNLYRRIPTAELNRFWEEVVQRHPPHASGSRSVRIKFLMQPQVAPPTILLFQGGSGRIPEQYLRFLQKEFRARWDFEGVPLVLVPRRAAGR